MELIFADTRQKIGVLTPDKEAITDRGDILTAARFMAKDSGKVVEVIETCPYCGVAAKPVSEMTLDEIFSFCCETSEIDSILTNEAQNECGLCGKYSHKSVTHKSCMDREQFLADQG